MTVVELRARERHRFMFSGSSVLVTNVDGGIGGDATEGFYFENTRLIERLDLRADGQPLEPVAASAVGHKAVLTYLQGPRQGKEEFPLVSSVIVELATFVEDGLRSELRIRNYHPRRTARFELDIGVSADFADIDEAEQGERQQTAEVESAWDDQERELTLRYQQADLNRAVAIRLETDEAVRFAKGQFSVPVELAPHAAVELVLSVEPMFDGRRVTPPRQRFGDAVTQLERVRSRLRGQAPRLTTTNPTVSRAWETAIEDLAALPLGRSSGLAAPSAGMPLYAQFFGRDVLTIAWQAAMAMPSMLKDALQSNAAQQGTVIDDWRDEEPGKLVHQARRGPLSELGKNPMSRYYGDYAAPPDFLIMLGQYLLWTGDITTVRQLLPAARKAIRWLDRYADLDRDGFIEYRKRSEGGVKNQGWKDAPNAIVDEAGDLVDNPIATSELQAYWYSGLRQVAIAFAAAGDRAYAIELLRKARDLKQRFNRAFWMEDEEFYALALGPDRQQVRSIASNAGHLLATGIVPQERAGLVARRLLAPDLFSGWGVRSLSAEHPAYNPFSYHLGSVWPVESGTFALGFGRYGLVGELHRLAEGLFAATDLFVSNRLPEALGGFARDRDHPHPGVYPKANDPQGWSSSALVLVVQALLGLRPVAPLNLLVVDPHLPPWLPGLRLEGVQVGNGVVDLEARRRRDGTTSYRITGGDGRVRVIRQPAPQAAQTSLASRASAALRSLPGRP